MYCKNCLEEVHTPDHRTGLIHTHGKYACFENGKRLETVAEPMLLDFGADEELPEYSGAI